MDIWILSIYLYRYKYGYGYLYLFPYPYPHPQFWVKYVALSILQTPKVETRLWALIHRPNGPQSGKNGEITKTNIGTMTSTLNPKP